ncbi:small secreted protein [Streptomyces sp. KLOTTS4A1]|uniref:small secreted protein n=1 Tax=Streptomyces sp. KLOTTS4A1 TaxID=3390996 RepID=UPI0039F49A99
MNKKLAAALSGGAVLVMALSACSSDDGNKELDDWAKSLCGQIKPELEKSAKAQQAIISTAADGKREEIKKVDSASFQASADAYTAIAKALEKAGPPPVDDGEKIQTDTVKDLQKASKSYQDLKKQSDAMDAEDDSPDGVKKFSEDLKKIADELGKIQTEGADALESLTEGEVGEAVAKQPDCKVDTPSPSN